MLVLLSVVPQGHSAQCWCRSAVTFVGMLSHATGALGPTVQRHGASASGPTVPCCSVLVLLLSYLCWWCHSASASVGGGSAHASVGGAARTSFGGAACTSVGGSTMPCLDASCWRSLLRVDACVGRTAQSASTNAFNDALCLILACTDVTFFSLAHSARRLFAGGPALDTRLMGILTKHERPRPLSAVAGRSFGPCPAVLCAACCLKASI
eukprot:1146015-Pelagomonas_calceolata.AAC.3